TRYHGCTTGDATTKSRSAPPQRAATARGLWLASFQDLRRAAPYQNKKANGNAIRISNATRCAAPPPRSDPTIPGITSHGSMVEERGVTYEARVPTPAMWIPAFA